MAISEKKKASNARWDKENMRVLACKVSAKKAEEFRAYAAARGHSVHSQLLESVDKCIGADQTDPDTESKRAALLEKLQGVTAGDDSKE